MRTGPEPGTNDDDNDGQRHNGGARGGTSLSTGLKWSTLRSIRGGRTSEVWRVAASDARI